MIPNTGRHLAWAACLVLLAGCGGGSDHPDGDADADGTDGAEDVLDGGDEAADAAEDAPAELSDSGDCLDGRAFNPYLTPPQCVDCTRECTLEGETGEHWAMTAVTGECVCTTLDGHYFSLSGAGVSHRCDKDQDGWLTRSARANIESADPAIAANARCTLRVVDRVVLLREGADPATDGCTIALADTHLGVASLPLYEADNRDDQDLLDEDSYAPAYGTRMLHAEELNGLTKACVSLIGDYNSNGNADVNEWDTAATSIDAFSYFIELHRGWFDGGAYYIQEKSRLADAPAGWGIPLVYNDDGYWRQCLRMTDSAFDPLGSNAIGMDFARYNGGTPNAGMEHHSQYKCVHIVEANDVPERYPQRLPIADLAAVPRRYVLNTCRAGDTSTGPVVGTVNPWDASLTCEIDTTPSIDDVGFVAVKYLPYATAGEYVRGCINGCIDDPPTCPPAASCAADVTDYGRPECVCPNHWTGTDCDLCPLHWDAATDCSVCLNAYDPAADCAACLAHYDIASDCTVCHPRWQLSSGCTTCINNYDVTSDCTTCLYHFDLATLCTECELHYDSFTLCATCLWNWDLATGCTSCTQAFSTTTDCRRTTNLLANPGAEAGSTSGWTLAGVVMTTSAAACSGHTSGPHGGTFRFLCCFGAGSQCQMTQDVDVLAYATGIDAGRYSVELDSWMRGYQGDAGIQLDFLDETGAPNGGVAQVEVAVDAWTRNTTPAPIPARTRTLRVTLDSDPSGGGLTDCAWDDLALYIVE
jgi:hypothetical protein